MEAAGNLRLRTPSGPSASRSRVRSRPTDVAPSDSVTAGPLIYYPTRYVAAVPRINDAKYPHRFFTKRTILMGSAILAAASVVVMMTWSLLSQALDNWYWNGAEPQWIWDHNIYDPPDNAPGNTTPVRKLLILQRATSPKASKILDATYRLNRAYAKHIQADYVRIDGMLALSDIVFDAINVKVAPEEGWVQYDCIIVLDPDAVFVEFGIHMLDMFGPNHLVGIAGNMTDADRYGSGMLLWNTRHRESNAALSLWVDGSFSFHHRDLPKDDITILFDVLRNTYNPPELFTMFQELQPPQVDYFSGTAVRFFRKPSGYERMSRLQWLEADWEDVAIVLEQLVDAICFKSHPKCDLTP